MTSRVGSLLVAGFLGAIALVAVVVIIVLTDDGAADDSAVIVASLREGDVVLLGDPTEIRVTVTDDEPITRIALFVDGEPISADAQPVNDPAQGTYSASIPWQPVRLGFVTITVTAQGLSGEESTTEFRVEVTDDPSRLGSDLTVSATRFGGGGLVVVNEAVRIQVRARSQEDIVAGFRMEIGGVAVAASGALESEPGVYDGILEWTPNAPGTVSLIVFAETTASTEASTELILDVVSAADAQAAGTTPDATEEPAEDAQAADQAEDGFLSIQTPAEGSVFALSDDLQVEIVVFADGVGTLVWITLLVDTAPIANVDGLQALSDGAYSLTIPWEPSGEGIFDLEVVAVSDTNRRFDDRVTVTVGPADGEDEEEDQSTAEIDLSPIAIEVGAGQSVVVTVANLGTGDLVARTVLISLIRTADGFVIDEASVVLTLGSGRSTAVELPIAITDSLDITVVVDSNGGVDESDESNNTISVTFAPPTRPDLVPQALQVGPDGTVSVRISNVGGGAAEPPIAVLIVLDGVVVEELSFNGPGPLAPQGTLDLFGSVVLEGAGTLSAIVDPANGIAESNDGNNAITITVQP